MTMRKYGFILKFDLPDREVDPDKFVDVLYEAGCDDATLGIGQNGRFVLSFIRESASDFIAVSSAIADVKKAIPGAKLIEAIPELVGLTDIADIVGCSRQNIRKMVVTHRAAFPSPTHEGSTVLWHLSRVLHWFRSKAPRLAVWISIKESGSVFS